MVLLYAFVQIAIQTLLPIEVARQSERVLAEAVGMSFGVQAGKLTAAIVVFSTFGAINSTLLITSRLGHCLAEDGSLPRWLAKRHESRHTPDRAILVSVVAIVIYLATSGFGDILGFFTFSVWLFYGLTAVGLLRLRYLKVGEPLRWRAPLGPLPPLVIILTGLLMTAGLLMEPTQRPLALKGLYIFVIFGAIYFIFLKKRGSSSRDAGQAT